MFLATAEAAAAQTPTTTCLSCLSWKMVAKWNGIWPSSSPCQGENVFACVAFQVSGLESVSELRYQIPNKNKIFFCFLNHFWHENSNSLKYIQKV